ncbi:hypothetical protein MCOR27_007391 [Pyricularia oryzae]|uniref:Uncharacterized protein n=5 Tax=Pyricularia TaxID=48558 RepID=A0ABQ8NMQ9_PYRGI|nr:zinc-regulated transporter 2 [Pyricularia oryzae 70-15]ELQ44623.1 zinc-regulated transporter 2 [Pyricularia oryzae Y34]KAH8847851.1 hypothetical protein MCOR01_001246 [Pyricularia oryzae]KAI6299477.1 hypothetical protein MCOR33_004610 [Pyricularia grisea]EHA52656.1 zinc-regulated transporter 2 [Pyricularia oryzae 70-15]KAH9430219.1 hypothetical protein MCOR02_009939 [Pyricularia oryzae]
MEGMKEPKPQCGGNKEKGEYDLPLHVAALFLVMAASIFGCGFPVVAKKVKWMKIPPKVFFACKHFGTGVLIATAFVHLLPTAFQSLNNPCLPDLFTENYPPMPGVIMMGSMFALFVVEMWINSKLGGHSHGGVMGYEEHDSHAHAHGPMVAAAPPPRPPRYNASSFEADDIEFEKRMAQQMYEQEAKINPFADPGARRQNPNEPPNVGDSEMPAWFVVFYEQYVRQRLEMMNMIRASERAQGQNTLAAPVGEKGPNNAVAVQDSPFIDEEGQQVDPAVYRKMSLNITMLEGGILFHSVFVGITISLTIDGFIILVIAILFHQMFEGLGLGSRIAAVPYPKNSIRPWLLIVAFGTTAPIGQAIGLAVRDSYDPDSAIGLITVGVFNAISSGLLIYAALVDLLAEDFLSEEAQKTLTKSLRIQAFSWVLLGAAGMSIVGAFA